MEVQLLFGLVRFRWPLNSNPAPSSQVALATQPPHKNNNTRKMDPFIVGDDTSLSAVGDDESEVEGCAIYEPKALRSFVSHADTTTTTTYDVDMGKEGGEKKGEEGGYNYNNNNKSQYSTTQERGVVEAEAVFEEYNEEEEEIVSFSNIAPATILQIDTNAYFKPRKQSTSTSNSHQSSSLVSMSEREWANTNTNNRSSFHATRQTREKGKKEKINVLLERPEYINRWSKVEEEEEQLPETLRWNDGNRRQGISLRGIQEEEDLYYGSRSRVAPNGGEYNYYHHYGPQLGVRQRLRSLGRLFSKEREYYYTDHDATTTSTSTAASAYSDTERPWDSRIHDALRRADSKKYYPTAGKMVPTRTHIITADTTTHSVNEHEKSSARIRNLLRGKRGTTRRIVHGNERRQNNNNNIPKYPKTNLRKVKSGLHPEWWGP